MIGNPEINISIHNHDFKGPDHLPKWGQFLPKTGEDKRSFGEVAREEALRAATKEEGTDNSI